MSRYIAVNVERVPEVDLVADSGGHPVAGPGDIVGHEETRRLRSYHPPDEDAVAAKEDEPANGDEPAPVTLRLTGDAQRRLVLEAFAEDEITEVNVATSALRDSCWR